MFALRPASGQELTEPTQICNCAMNFYSKLYESELVYSDTVARAIFHGLPKVTRVSQSEKTLTLQELDQGLMSMERMLNLLELMGYLSCFIKSFGLLLEKTS